MRKTTPSHVIIKLLTTMIKKKKKEILGVPTVAERVKNLTAELLQRYRFDSRPGAWVKGSGIAAVVV